MKKSKRPSHLKHLGGHMNVTHIDEGLVEWMISFLKIKNFLDIGCGPGGMVEFVLSKGIHSVGVDGDPLVERNITGENFVLHDFCSSPLSLKNNFDVAWSCEFVEHVEEKFLQNYMETFKSANYVVMTFAPPGTPGYHHVNCKSAEYWIDQFKNINYEFDKDLTDTARSKSTMTRDFFRKNGLVFKRKI
jgi:SAM-dependent methyltransferase